MAERGAVIEPYAHGMLDVGDDNLVYWEACGNPEGKPVLIVHGGPGSGCSPRMRQGFDPDRWRVVLFDQRGCGRSTPHASDPATDMSHNTTRHLVADMERLREHLGVDRWLLLGGSWGSTLILAYAQQYPHRVSEIIISSVTTTRQSEIDWLYRGARQFFPEAWERFRAGVPEAERDGDLVAAYARLMENPDPLVRERAAVAWSEWENAVVSLEPGGKANFYSDQPTRDLVAFVRICARYSANRAWLEDGVLLRNAGRLAGIPGVLIHGRLDLSCPVDTAWELARVWPDAELVVLDDAGHQWTASKRERMTEAFERFAPR
ncbi:prolyl aminopeptidase [Streptoalloteichus hindustanus]|uniref:Proline iminopeptidase n=1 Tax=Streptoalloteichus hindustanus TaxID=2017 RepID=A0A1M5I9B9_STRHI|nr:prolyl aminopeptidase [Streptoalloteichus hindustanus]SHG24842.1 proline iminopeptidase [Streptoalloteichus hindustanus]